MNNVEPVHEEVEPVEPDNNEMHQEMEPPLEQEQQANNENSKLLDCINALMESKTVPAKMSLGLSCSPANL